MVEPRFLPHLAAACRELLGDDEVKNIPTGTRARVATYAEVGQPTVERFLEGKRVPRSKELDAMVAAVAATAKTEWYLPWGLAVKRAEDAKVDWQRYLNGELPIAAPDDPTEKRRRPPR